jgi:predicted nucleotidyltransferase/biotin operon repressor
MRIHQPLNKILNNETKVKVLRFLYSNDIEWSGRRIAREIQISPATCHKALQELYSEGILLLRNVGKTYLYQFNHDNYVAKELLHPLFKKEERLLKVISRLLRDEFSEKVKERIVSIALFGSVEKREDRPDSDIDLLVLVSRAKDKEKIEKAFDNLNEKTVRLFGKIVSPYIESASGFRRKYRQGLPVVKEIVQSHKLISGKSLREVI